MVTDESSPSPEMKEIVAQSETLRCELLKEAGGKDSPSTGGTDSLLCLLELHARARLIDPKAATAAAAYKRLDILLDSLIASKGVSTLLLTYTSDILRQPPSSSRDLSFKALSHAIDIESSLLLIKPKTDVLADMSMVASDDAVVAISSTSDTSPKTVDLELVSSLLRRLLLLSQTKLDSLVVFKRALRIIQQSLMNSEQTYPREEADWMAVTAWNTGVFFCRMGASARAEPFLSFAIDEMVPVLQRLCSGNEEFSETLSNLPTMKAQLIGVRDELIRPAATPTAVSASMFTTPNLHALLAPPKAPAMPKPPSSSSSSSSLALIQSAPPLPGASVRPLYFDADVEEVAVGGEGHMWLTET